MSDEKLRLALEEYDAAVLAALPEPSECTHKFSPRFERKMRALCRRAKHPVAYKTLQRIACILLVLLALFGSIMAISAEAREFVRNWIKETHGQGTRYSYQGEQVSNIGESNGYELGWIPDGYVLEYDDADELSAMTVYYGESPNMLVFMYLHSPKPQMSKNAVSLYIDSRHSDMKTVTLNTGTADIFIDRRAGKNNAIIWSNGKELFCITAPCSEETLIKMAENILKKI